MFDLVFIFAYLGAVLGAVVLLAGLFFWACDLLSAGRRR